MICVYSNVYAIISHSRYRDVVYTNTDRPLALFIS